MHCNYSKNPNFIKSFLVALKLACDSKKIYKGAATWFLALYVTNTLANALISLMRAWNRFVLFATSAQYKQHPYRKLLRLYLEVKNNFLKKFLAEQVISKHDAAALRYLYPVNMTV